MGMKGLKHGSYLLIPSSKSRVWELERVTVMGRDVLVFLGGCMPVLQRAAVPRSCWGIRLYF